MRRSPSQLGTVRRSRIGTGRVAKMYVENSTENPADKSVAASERRV
jgi:hypothetical protein